MKNSLKLWFICFIMMALLAGCGNKETKQTEEEPVTETEIVEEEKNDLTGNFEVHFIDVGQADATLVMCDGYNMLIDGGNPEDSDLIYSYLKNHNIDTIDYMIATHAHTDHVGGLAGALNYAQTDIVYCPVQNDELDAFQDFKKYVEAQGKEITVPEAGSEFMLGGAKCTILGVNTFDDDPNNTSIVLKIEYGNTSFLFSGDATEFVENAVIENGYDISCTVMKVPHHGSDTSSSQLWLDEAMPEYAVISSGEGNSHGHPSAGTLNKLFEAQVKLFRTDMQGDVICTSDGESVEFKVEKNPEADVFIFAGLDNAEENVEDNEQNTQKTQTSGNYILNLNTLKFHYPNCKSVDDMKEKNKQESSLSRDEIIAQGYSPCGNCHP